MQSSSMARSGLTEQALENAGTVHEESDSFPQRGFLSKRESGKRGVAGHQGRHADIDGDPLIGAEPPVEEVPLKITIYRERLRVGSYRVMLDVPGELVRFVSGLLAAHRREIGRADPVGHQ